MFTVIKGAGVLLLLSVFFAYLLVPIVERVRRRMRFGPRQRPPSIATVLACLYIAGFLAGAAVWERSAGSISHVVNVSMPRTIDRLFSGSQSEAISAFIERMPNGAARRTLGSGARKAVRYIEGEVRRTLDELLAAARFAAWLGVIPLVAFLLLTTAPGFRRSAERLLPHGGHLQWRAEEYARDVNSALAGYVRAQLAAALIVAGICTAGFVLLRLPYAPAMGIAAGVLELVPAIGPIATLVMATVQADPHVVGVIVFLGAVRVVQDYVIYPRLIRRGMHLSTPVVVISIWSGAVFAGAAGVILAIPVAGFVSVSLRHWSEYRAIERIVRDYGRGAGENV